jgi:hypothetical protein
MNETATVALPLRAPEFVTARYPRIPARNPADPAGYLRITETPRALPDDVIQEARRLGWAEAIAVEVAVPPPTTQVLTAAPLLSAEAALGAYVARQIGEPAHRQAVTDAGLAYLRQADAR